MAAFAPLQELMLEIGLEDPDCKDLPPVLGRLFEATARKRFLRQCINEARAELGL